MGTSVEIEKKCKHCHEIKPLSKFPKNKEMKDGHINRCNACSVKATMVSRNKPEHKKNFRSKSYQRYYGISIETYDEMREKQNHRCFICDKHETDNGRFLAVDHDHDTGAVRKLLCNNCNSALGLLMDSPVILEKATKYLKDHGRVS